MMMSGEIGEYSVVQEKEKYFRESLFSRRLRDVSVSSKHLKRGLR